MKKVKQLLVTMTLLFCLFPVIPVSAKNVTGSAVTENVYTEKSQDLDKAVEEENVVEYDLKEVVEIFSAGIACGIVFSLLIFILSVLINLFFDIVKK